MKRTAGVKLIWSVAVLILVPGVAAVDFTRNEDSLGNLDIYEVIVFQHKSSLEK